MNSKKKSIGHNKIKKMKYFMDCEFSEGTQTKRILGIPYGKTKPTIDLISIGIVSEDTKNYIGGIDPIDENAEVIVTNYQKAREYYTICKEFNLKAAWNNKWLRDNVLKNLFNNSIYMNYKEVNTFKGFKRLVNHFGKTKKQIAEEIKKFVFDGAECSSDISKWGKNIPIEFYGYYADYDWVVFCWIFGNMIDLPTGFPMYCKDLKQMMDDKGLDENWKRKNCPDPKGEHNSLIDAKWNSNLFNKINQKL